MLTTLTTKQAEVFLTPKRRLNIWDGSIRAGKTVESLVEWVKLVRAAPPGNLLMVGRTERTLKRNVIDQLVEWLGPKRCRLVAGSGELHLLGRRVYIAGANDERSAQKIGGLTLYAAYGDELSTWPESMFTMVIGRLSMPEARFFGTTNPDGPAHWLKRNYLDRGAELDLAHFRFKLTDNPTLDPEYVEQISREYVGLWRLRYIDGEWAMAEGAIYPMWDPARFVVDRLPAMTETWWLGIDYGTASSDFVALLFGMGQDGRVYVAGEWRWAPKVRGHRRTDAEYSREILAWLVAMNVDPILRYVDPSASSFIEQLWRDGHVGVRNEASGVIDGIRKVASAMEMDRVRVHRSCAGLIEEMPSYRWDEKAQQRGVDQPRKEADHGPDALRYGLVGAEYIWRRTELMAAA